MKLILRVFMVFFLLVTLAVGTGYAWLRQSLPQLDGTITLSGLKAPVEIVRGRVNLSLRICSERSTTACCPKTWPINELLIEQICPVVRGDSRPVAAKPW